MSVDKHKAIRYSHDQREITSEGIRYRYIATLINKSYAIELVVEIMTQNLVQAHRSSCKQVNQGWLLTFSC